MSGKKKAVPGDIATRHIGFCALCERDIKLNDAAYAGEAPRLVLVHHGYKRPGDGRIHGDCFAVGREPYELSAEPLVEYRARLVSMRAGTVESLEALRGSTYFERHSVSYRDKRVVTLSYSLFVTRGYVFESMRDQKVRETEREIAEMDREIERLTKWIDGWALKPVRTEEELVRAAAEKRAEAAARVAAASAERAAKRAAIDAKHAERAAREEAEKQAIIEETKRLHAEGTWARDAKPVIKLAARIRRNKNAWKWIYKAGIDNELVALGLAYRSNGYIQLSSSCI